MILTEWSAPRLPVEILTIILDEIEDKSVLFKSRLISKDFMDVATPRALRKLIVSREKTSLEGIQNLANSPLAKFVFEVTFKEHNVVSSWHTDEPFRVAMLHIPAFPNVTSLQVSFPARCYVEVMNIDDEVVSDPDEETSEPDEAPVSNEDSLNSKLRLAMPGANSNCSLKCLLDTAPI